ncbi:MULTISPECIES: DUF2790 domain-containing protein [unclassified Pseudomonas]|jgi:hypothetical protein|uniref:DUF2790 domain-containing protein n=1 Tax=unclassified Pseudomonas TaxID=196821 RepID=UPI001054581E|nr:MULTISPECIES: DUF2790 domain-containing protein [unclassified Pseudomonas]MBW3505221.1 DUF2790 domain-containing protein [Pseudomonas sp. NKUCC02_KPG]MEC4240510.1 DUF2790 domain-containing protein [Pseudomonas sp. DSV-1]
MKRLIVLALLAFSTLAAAEDVKVAPQQPAVEHYTYATDLDIATVISVTPIADVCEVVPAQMTYEDHQGQRHILEYRVMGNGCSNG